MKKSVSIFSYEDYRKVIRDTVGRARASGGLNFTRIAEAIQVQPPYLSRVMTGDGDLSSDQMYLLCRYFDLNDEENQYMQLLLEYSKTGLAFRKKSLKQKIQGIQKAKLATENAIQAELASAKPANTAAYYIDPWIPIVHICLTIPTYREDPKRILKSLPLSESYLGSILQSLEENHYIRRLPAVGYEVLREHIHISTQDPFCHPYQLMTRQLSLAYLSQKRDSQQYSFNVTFTASEEVRKQVQTRFLQFLSEVEPQVQNADSQHLFQMNFDLFKWD